MRPFPWHDSRSSRCRFVIRQLEDQRILDHLLYLFIVRQHYVTLLPFGSHDTLVYSRELGQTPPVYLSKGYPLNANLTLHFIFRRLSPNKDRLSCNTRFFTLSPSPLKSLVFPRITLTSNSHFPSHRPILWPLNGQGLPRASGAILQTWSRFSVSSVTS